MYIVRQSYTSKNFNTTFLSPTDPTEKFFGIFDATGVNRTPDACFFRAALCH